MATTDRSDESIDDIDGDVNEIMSRLEALQAQTRALKIQNKRLKTAIAGSEEEFNSFDVDDIESVFDRLDELEDDMKVANATASKNKRGKVEKAIDAIEFATSEKIHGPAGVTITSGEVAAAANCSKSRALTLMDELAGSLEWAEAETPGGPKPKQLRLTFGDREIQELVDDVLEEWGDAE